MFYSLIVLKVYVKANQDESLKADALAYFSKMESSNFLSFYLKQF